jgi:hypothetical protein
MAVVVELRAVGTRDDHDAADVKVEEAMGKLGGPPNGLMFHLTWPDGDGFVVLDVWRTEQAAREFLDSVVLPAFGAAGLSVGEPTIRPVWGMAQPPTS